jgi:hypothetical protein
VSRFRMAILFALAVVAALPAGAHARSLSYCHLFSANAVGHAAGYRGIRMSERSVPFVAASGAKGRGVVCDYASGRDPVAQWSVGTLGSKKAAAAEFAGDIRTRRTDGSETPKRIRGPWDKAYIVGDREIYALRGRHILHLAYWVPSRGSRVIGLVKTAARKM